MSDLKSAHADQWLSDCPAAFALVSEGKGCLGGMAYRPGIVKLRISRKFRTGSATARTRWKVGAARSVATTAKPSDNRHTGCPPLDEEVTATAIAAFPRFRTAQSNTRVARPSAIP